MMSRVLALLLSFVMLWSGVGAIEAPSASARPVAGLAPAFVDAHRLASVQEGSVEQHHLDDLPMQVQVQVQVHSDAATEPLGLLPSILTTRVASVLLLPAPAPASADSGPPFLAGPLRPPCIAARTG